MYKRQGITASEYGDVTQARKVTSSDGEMGKGKLGNGELGNDESGPSRQWACVPAITLSGWGALLGIWHMAMGGPTGNLAYGSGRALRGIWHMSEGGSYRTFGIWQWAGPTGQLAYVSGRVVKDIWHMAVGLSLIHI